jgi:hypothetical protein
MTMIVACEFSDSVVVFADTRVTMRERGRAARVRDELQKIIAFGNRGLLAYAGDVKVAASTYRALIRQASADPRRRYSPKLLADLPRVARYQFRELSRAERREAHVSFIVVLVNERDRIEVYSYDSPHFQRLAIEQRVVARGTGSFVSSKLVNRLPSLDAAPIKGRVDSIIVMLENELSTRDDDTVGGMLVGAVVSAAGVQPIDYGFAELNPDGVAYSRSVEFSAGRWIQRDRVGRREVPLRGPMELVAHGGLRLNDFRPPSAVPRWHLTYLVTCFKRGMDIGALRLDGVWDAIATPFVPRGFETIVAFGLWGTEGKHRVDLVLVEKGDQTVVATKEIEIRTIHVEMDFAFPVTLPITRGGVAAIEVRVDGTPIGRRVVFVHVAPLGIRTIDEWAREERAAMAERRREVGDEELGDPSLVYLSICQGCRDDRASVEFDRQVAAVFVPFLPYSVQLVIAPSVRCSPGERHAELELANANTGDVVRLAQRRFTTKSGMDSRPMHGTFLIPFAASGPYFVSLKLDGARLGSALVLVEGPSAQFGFSLSEKAQAELRGGGGPMILLRRSRSELGEPMA